MNDLAEMREVSLIVMGYDGSMTVSTPIDDPEPSYLAALIGANDADNLQLFPMFNYYAGKAAKVFVNKNAPIGSKNMNATMAYYKEYELIHKHAPKTNVYGNMLIITGPADTIDAIGPE